MKKYTRTALVCTFTTMIISCVAAGTVPHSTTTTIRKMYMPFTVSAKAKSADSVYANDTELVRYLTMKNAKDRAYLKYQEDIMSELNEELEKVRSANNAVFAEEEKRIEAEIKAREEEAARRKKEEELRAAEAISKAEQRAKSEEVFTQYKVEASKDFKSYMDYRAIKSNTSDQWALQHDANTYTGDYGIRMVDDRYCIAIGSYFTQEIGTKIDVVLENGKTIKCILADCKADKDTDANGIYHIGDGSLMEFVVDSKVMDETAKKMGSFHWLDEFEGRVTEVRVFS